jgi:hypothetical protein
MIKFRLREVNFQAELMRSKLEEVEEGVEVFAEEGMESAVKATKRM